MRGRVHTARILDVPHSSTESNLDIGPSTIVHDLHPRMETILVGARTYINALLQFMMNRVLPLISFSLSISVLPRILLNKIGGAIVLAVPESTTVVLN